MMTALTIVIAIILDRLLGEPRRFHPLVGLGNAVGKLELKLWTAEASRFRGLVAVAVLLLALIFLVFCIQSVIAGSPLITLGVVSVVVYWSIAPRSLSEHAIAVSDVLRAGDIERGRHELSRIVSRDTENLSEPEIVAACCESVLENGSDGIFAALFWFCAFSFISGDYSQGLYGIVLYRAANTLDAMWGYRNPRYLRFGWAAARLDDLLNYIPARLVAFSYALVGNYATAMRCWITQGRHWKSPNAGAVMASGAGSPGISLGGDSVYDGVVQSRPVLGCGREPRVSDISAALALVSRTLILWVVSIGLIDSLLRG